MNRSVLFLQKPELIENQKLLVREHFRIKRPEIDVSFASKPEDISAGLIPIVITPTLPWLSEALSRVDGLEWVHFLSSGIDEIWKMPFDWASIMLTKSAGIHGPQISEYVIGAMLHFAKDFDRFIVQSNEKRWHRNWLPELSECTVMILGAGHVGEWVARRCKHFDMHVISVKRRPSELRFSDLCIGLTDIKDHLDKVDYLVVCLPLTDDSKGLVDKELLGRLAPGVVLVDVSRGGVVDQMAVLSALKSKRLRGAALDVFEIEPLPESSELWARRDVLLTPHVSGTSPRYMERALDLFLENFEAWQIGDPMITSVDKLSRY